MNTVCTDCGGVFSTDQLEDGRPALEFCEYCRTLEEEPVEEPASEQPESFRSKIAKMVGQGKA